MILELEKVFNEAVSLISSTPASKIRNVYFCSNIFSNTFLKKYLALFSMWSGVHLVDMNKTRDTNSHIENWFRIIKNSIFNGERMRPQQFIFHLLTTLLAQFALKLRKNTLNKLMNSQSLGQLETF